MLSGEEVRGESTEDTVRLGDSTEVVVDSSTEELLLLLLLLATAASRGEREVLEEEAEDHTFRREWTWETMDSSRSRQEGSPRFFFLPRLEVLPLKLLQALLLLPGVAALTAVGEPLVTC